MKTNAMNLITWILVSIILFGIILSLELQGVWSRMDSGTERGLGIGTRILGDY